MVCNVGLLTITIMSKLLIAFLSVFLLTGCNLVVPAASEDELAASCKDSGGQWFAQHRECVIDARAWCDEHSGSYETCASACRHNPDPTAVCTLECVAVCSL